MREISQEEKQKMIKYLKFNCKTPQQFLYFMKRNANMERKFSDIE